MGQTISYPDGTELTSSALTLAQINTLMVPIALGMLGQNSTAVDPNSGLVRIEYPTMGAPFAKASEDICYVRCSPKEDPYDRIRDRVNSPNNSSSLEEQWSYTRAWAVHFTHYGPNSLDLARAIRSGLYQDYFTQALAQSNLFPVSDIAEVVRVPENINGQWFERADLEVEMYEAVTETILRQTVVSAEVIGRIPAAQIFDVKVV